MAKDNSLGAPSLLQDMFQAGVYKRSQGKIARQVTFAALLIVIALGCWRLYWTLSLTSLDWLQYSLPGGLLLAGLWFSYRIVNYPRFADFLIAVEAEMNKVSWPTRTELYRSSLVVIFVIFALAGVLFAFDLLWKFAFGPNGLGILQ